MAGNDHQRDDFSFSADDAARDEPSAPPPGDDADGTDDSDEISSDSGYSRVTVDSDYEGRISEILLDDPSDPGGSSGAGDSQKAQGRNSNSGGLDGGGGDNGNEGASV
ncbi:unnamed protein product, partial [Phaeothamnion confervicola]